MNVTHLSITPAAVIDDLQEMLNQGEIESIFAVAILKDKRPTVAASGDLKGLAFAIMVLQNFWDQVFE